MFPRNPKINQAGNNLKPVSNRTLVTVRWIAIGGQSAAVLVSAFVFDITLPLILIALVILASCAVNLFAMMYYGLEGLKIRSAALFLAFDLIQLSTLLWLTGGHDNPFTVLMLAPVTVAAALLPTFYTLWLTLVAIGATYIINISPFALNWNDHQGLPENIEIIGSEIALSIALIFIATYVWKISLDRQNADKALQSRELLLAGQREIASLGAQAAATTHELGSPLNTIALIANDLQKDLQGTEYETNISLLNDQVRRCRDIIRDFARRNDNLTVIEKDVVCFKEFIETLSETYQGLKDTTFTIHEKSMWEDSEKTLYVEKTPELSYGIGNIIQNAFQYCKKKVYIHIIYNENNVTLKIEDDGPGIPGEKLKLIADPFANRNMEMNKVARTKQGTSHQKGLGIGLYLSYIILEQMNGSLRIDNLEDFPYGASVSVKIPLSEIEYIPDGSAEDKNKLYKNNKIG